MPATSRQPRSYSLAASAVIIGIGTLLAQGSSILAAVALARLVSKHVLGTYQQLSLMFGFVSPLVLGGVPSAILYFVPRSQSAIERSAWVIRAYVVLACAGALSALIAVAVAHPVSHLFHNPQLAPALIRYGPYLFFAYIAAATPIVLVAVKAPGRAALTNALVGGSILAGVLSAAIISPNANALAIGLSVGEGIGALSSLIVLRRTLTVRFADRDHPDVAWRPLVSFGLPLAMASLAGSVGYQFDRAVVGANFPPQLYALYALGAIEFPLAQMAQQAVGNALAPALAMLWRDGKAAEMVLLFRESARKTTLLLAPLGAFMAIETPDIVHLLYGSGYGGTAAIFRIYLLYLPIRLGSWGLIPRAIGRTRIIFVAGLLALAGNGVLALVLVHPLGLQGPALAGPVTEFYVMLFYIEYITRVMDIRVSDLLPLSQIVAIFAVSGAVALAVLPAQAVAIGPVIRLAGTALIFITATMCALRLTRLLTANDWARLSRLLDARRLTHRRRSSPAVAEPH